jgi:hypothetical protein
VRHRKDLREPSHYRSIIDALETTCQDISKEELIAAVLDLPMPQPSPAHTQSSAQPSPLHQEPVKQTSHSYRSVSPSPVHDPHPSTTNTAVHRSRDQNDNGFSTNGQVAGGKSVPIQRYHPPMKRSKLEQMIHAKYITKALDKL